MYKSLNDLEKYKCSTLRAPFSRLRSRRLEVVGERENARPFFLVPTTSKRLLLRLPPFISVPQYTDIPLYNEPGSSLHNIHLHLSPVFSNCLILSCSHFRQLEEVGKRTENIEIRRLKEDLRTSRIEIQ